MYNEIKKYINMYIYVYVFYCYLGYIIYINKYLMYMQNIFKVKFNVGIYFSVFFNMFLKYYNSFVIIRF